jgi:ligand-binding sensor protein
MVLWEKMKKRKWQELLDHVAKQFNIHTALMDSEGKILLEGGHYNTLCSKIRADPDSLRAVCSQTNTSMSREARTSGKPCTDYCEAGMFKTFVPIFDGDSYIGGLSACGLVVENEPLEAFLISKVIGIDENEVERYVKEISVVEAEVAQRISKAFMRFLDDDG